MSLQAPAPAAPMSLSTHRPVPLIRRCDLVVTPVDFQGVWYFVIKDPIGLKYHRLPGEQYAVLELLNGQRSLEAIRDAVVRKFPTFRPTLVELQALVASLHQQGLAISNRPGQGRSRREQSQETKRRTVLSACMNVLAIRLPGYDPDRLFRRMLPFVAWMFHPVALMSGLLLIAAASAWLAIHHAEFVHRLPEFSQFFGWENLLWMWVTIGVTKIFHELGHGLSCRYFGAECHQIGVTFLAFCPSLYCDVSDSWTLPSKWQRIAIGAAGMYVESLIAAVAVFVWWFTVPGLINTLALNVVFVSAVSTAIFNANPLMRLDGYYILSDFWEIPNLRQHADETLQRGLARLILGAELAPAHHALAGQRRWLAVYALASTLYGWTVLAGMILILYSWLKPYGLQSISATLATAAMAGSLAGVTMTARKVAKLPRLEPLKPRRLAGSALVLALLLAIFFLVPIPWYRAAMFTLEPKLGRQVHTVVAGQLSELRVQPGDAVAAGDVLARLEDPETEDRERKLRVERLVQRQEIALNEAVDDLAAAALAREALASVERELEDVQAILRQLVIVAPVSGTIIAPPAKPRPKLEIARQRLDGWSGTPLDPRNAGCFLPEQTHLLDIAPSDKAQAVIYLDQSDLGDVRPSMAVRLKFEHQLHEVYSGTVREISSAQFETIPPRLSTKFGGTLPTVTTADGQEQLEDAVYKAIVDLDRAPAVWPSGLRGEARFIVAHRTAWQWCWRAIRRTFNFRL